MTGAVFDASSLLAVLFAETGADAIRRQLRHGIISAVNYSETLGRAVDRGIPLETTGPAASRLELAINPFDDESAAPSASLRAVTRPHGLSFADRACLALGLPRGLPVLTADRAWARLDIGVTVTQIR